MSKVVKITAVFLFGLLTIATAIGSSTGKIEGKVFDKKTGKPLPYANLLVKGTSYGAASDENGNYFVNVPAGEYTIRASMMGYKTQNKKVKVFPDRTATVNFYLVESVAEMEQVVVTATRTPRYIKDIPVRTEVITNKAIEEKGATNLYQALKGMPGVRVEQQCSHCNFSMVRIQGLASGHTQVLIDGEPIFSGLAGVYGLQQIPSANIDRIELVKGAGSALYGSNAIAGVINIVTKEPTSTPTIQASATFETHNSKALSLSASTKKNNMGMMLTAQKNSGDEIDEDGDGYTDRVRSDNINTGIILDLDSLLGNDKLTLTGRTLNEHRMGGEVTTFENPFAESAEHIRTARYEAQIGYKKDFRRGGNIAMSIATSFHHRNATNDAFLGDYMATHGDTVPAVDEMQPYLAYEKLYVVDMRYSYPFGETIHLLTGIDYSHNRLEETGRYVIVDTTDSNYGGAYTSESVKHADNGGAYCQGEFHISDAFEIDAGARYDIHHSEDNFGGSGKVAPKQRIAVIYDEKAFNPRLAMRFDLSSSITLRASTGTGFRVPYGFSEDLHLCSGSPRVNKPAGLKPEKSISFNLGLDYTGETKQVSINLFRTSLKDKIGFTDASEESKKLGYTYEWANIDDAYTQGIELGTRVLLLWNLSINADLAYTDAQYEHNRDDWVAEHPQYTDVSKYIPRVPQLTSGIKLEWTPGDWNITIDADYTGRMYIDYAEDDDIASAGSKIVHTPDFWVVNPRLSKTFSKGITAFIGAKNIFDYTQQERHPDDAAFMFAPYTGREIYGGIKIHLGEI